VAALRSAEKLANLARRASQDFLKQNGALPDGFFFYLVGLIKQSLSSMPAHKISEVGGGLFGDEAAALALLEKGLKDRPRSPGSGGAHRAGARALCAPHGASRNGLSFWNA